MVKRQSARKSKTKNGRLDAWHRISWSQSPFWNSGQKWVNHCHWRFISTTFYFNDVFNDFVFIVVQIKILHKLLARFYIASFTTVYFCTCVINCTTYFAVALINALFTCWQVDAYLANTDTVSEVLTYWENKSLLWPKLGQVARGLLGIPVASTSSERVFSTAGWTVDERRTALSGDSVDGCGCGCSSTNSSNWQIY